MLDANAGAEERNGSAGRNNEEGNNAGTSSRGAQEQIDRSVDESERSIKMFDRMSRQPTVEDDDSDKGQTSVPGKAGTSAAPSVQRLKPVREEDQRVYQQPYSGESDANGIEGTRRKPSSSRLENPRVIQTPDHQPTRSQISPSSNQSPSTKGALKSRDRSRESFGGPSIRTSRRIELPRDPASSRSGTSSSTSSDSAAGSAQDLSLTGTKYIPVRTARSGDDLTDLDELSIKAQQSSTENTSEYSDTASSASHATKPTRKAVANHNVASTSLDISDDDYTTRTTKSYDRSKDSPGNRAYVSHRVKDKTQSSGSRQRGVLSEIEERSTSEGDVEMSWDLTSDSQPSSRDRAILRQSRPTPIAIPSQKLLPSVRASQGRRANVDKYQRRASNPRPENMVFKFAAPPPVPSSVGTSSPKQQSRQSRRAVPSYSSSSSSGDKFPGYPPPPPPLQSFPGNVNYYNTPYAGYQEHVPNPFATSGPMPNPFAPLGPPNYGQHFYQPPHPPPPPPPVTSPGHPVVRELRALLAPPIHDLPPLTPPELPVAGSYESDDDDETRTVVAEPRSGQDILHEPLNGLSHADLSADFDADRLEELRFEARIPLHPYKPTLTKKWPELSSVEDEHSRRRYEALRAHRFRRGDDGWQSIELQCRQGPSSSLTSEHAQVEWLHIASDSMNLGTLEDHCLGAPSITQELQYVVARLFEKIRKFHQRRFFDGYLLTPGTVLRWDGITSGYDTAQNLTATFVCFPYLTLQPFATRDKTEIEDYPSRSILQTLYPYDSTFKQDMPPSFSKIAPSAAGKVMLVPQIWCVSIGHKYVITCTQLTPPELCKETVRISQYSPESDATVPQWRSGSRQDSTDQVEESGSILLFEGKRVEEYEISEHPDASGERNLAVSRPPKANTWHNLSSAVNATWSQQAEQNLDRPSSSGHGRNPAALRSRWRAAGPTSRSARHSPNVPIDSDTLSQIRVDELKPTAAMMSTLESPEYTPDYVETVRTCLASLIKKWPIFVSKPAENFGEELQQIQQGIQIADQLQKILDLEEANPDLAARGEYRASLIRIFGLRRIEQEVAALGEIIEVVYRLIRESGTREAQVAFNMKTPREDVPAIKETNDLRTIAEGSFLAWPWISSSMGTVSEPTEEDANRLSDNLRRILQDSNDRIQGRDDRSYSATTKATLTTLSNLLISFRASLSEHGEGPPCPEDHSERLPQFDAQNLAGSSGRDPQIIQSEHRRQLTVAAIETLVKASQDLVAKFVPCIFPHHVLEKIWGSLEATSRLMMDSLDHDRWMRPPAYIIRQPNETIAVQHNFPPPATPLKLCTSCNSGYLYGTWPEALAHVKSHFRYARSLTLEDHLREDWIQKANSVRSDLVNTHHLRIAKISTEYLEMLNLRAKSIHERTQSRGEDDSRYTLPGGLVDCFETIALFITQVGTIMFGTQKEIECRDWLPIVEVELQMGPYALSRLGHLGQAAQQAMTRAEKALFLSDITATVELESAGPELLVAILLQNIQRRALLPEDDQRNYALYHTYVSRLQYQISRFPRRRLLHDIHVLEEEVEVVRKVNEWQQRCFEDLMVVTDPRSFSSPAEDRVATFPAERAGLQQSLDHLDIESRELEALLGRIQHLRHQLRQSVEILEEDHGKAIFVFTMVTTIFLPLSFVSSFFGMNFADIRDMERTQGLFWACAVPVTAGIIIIAVSLANHGDKVFETLNRIWQRIKDRERDFPLTMVTADKQNLWHGSTTGLPQTQSTQRQKRAMWKR